MKLLSQVGSALLALCVTVPAAAELPRLVSKHGRHARRSSLAAVDDQAVRQVVGRYGDAHAIARQHTDVMAPHATRELGANDRSALVDANVVLAATECVLNHAFHFQQIALAHIYDLIRSSLCAAFWRGAS